MLGSMNFRSQEYFHAFERHFPTKCGLNRREPSGAAPLPSGTASHLRSWRISSAPAITATGKHDSVATHP
jgi:hypothetical protein